MTENVLIKILVKNQEIVLHRNVLILARYVLGMNVFLNPAKMNLMISDVKLTMIRSESVVTENV